MSVSLTKGSKINLVKEAQNLGVPLSRVNVGLGWDCNNSGGSDYDLDAWALAVTDKGLKRKTWFILVTPMIHQIVYIIVEIT